MTDCSEQAVKWWRDRAEKAEAACVEHDRTRNEDQAVIAEMEAGAKEQERDLRFEILAHKSALDGADAQIDQLRQQSHELAADLRKAEAEVAELRKTLQLCREAANRDLEAKRSAEAEVARLRVAMQLIRRGAEFPAAIAYCALENL